MMIGLIAIGAALAIAIPALATALAQSRIGAAMAGAVAERPELVGSAIIMVAIPETMVILGLVIAFMITTLKAGVK
ncbi:MAG: ATPase [Actinobacteria bacterium]|nr:ATPase [Actinomycetota bacterium]